MPIAPDVADHLLVSLVRNRIEAAELAREIAPTRKKTVAVLELAQKRAEREVLRRALVLRDRSVARKSLRAMAGELGVALDETDHDDRRLAMRVLLDAMDENLRRDQSHYSEASAAPVMNANPAAGASSPEPGTSCDLPDGTQEQFNDRGRAPLLSEGFELCVGKERAGERAEGIPRACRPSAWRVRQCG